MDTVEANLHLGLPADGRTYTHAAAMIRDQGIHSVRLATNNLEKVKALEFELPDQHGERRALADYRGRWVFLYFYPKDGTPGCIAEAQAIRDRFAVFETANVAVLGVSGDSVESHKHFAEQHQLQFTLLSDMHGTVAEAYGALRASQSPEMGTGHGGVMRKSFLINIFGGIEKIYHDVHPKSHADEVLRDLLEIKRER